MSDRTTKAQARTCGTACGADAATRLARTPLHALHERLGARTISFAGYGMPVSYPAGVLKEHLSTREGAGLFDVSHMGQIALRDRRGGVAAAAAALEALVPADLAGLVPGRQRYGVLTSATGGALDDLMVANLGDRLVLIVNAARKEADEAHLRAHLPDDVEIEPLDRALIALQGPKAEATLARLSPETAAMRFMDARAVEILGATCVVSRSGYSGEDGFEISTPPESAEAVAEALLDGGDVSPAGLGARDSLRLEAGLCLYGADLDDATSPAEAALAWSIPKVRRRGGAREGGFPGAERILGEIDQGPARLRVGLKPEGRAPVRSGAPLFAEENAETPAGVVTSGGFGPSVGAPVAMGYVPAALSSPGIRLFAELRGQRVAVTVAALPFVPARFKRG